MEKNKTNRNDPCTCGSGKKYKQCCMSKSQAVSAPVNFSIQSARNLFNQGFISDAEAICHEILQAKPSTVSALDLLGAIALQQGKTQVAVELIAKAIRLDSKNPEYFNNLGLAYHEQGFLDDAIRQYQRAIALAPNYADAHYNLHAALLNAENTDPALSCLKKVLAINARDLDAVFMLGVITEYAGDTESAQPYLDAVKQASKLYQARYDAWQYIKASQVKIPVMGSAINTFKYSMKHASVQGLVLEFGVRFGNSIHMLANLANQQVHGFDSFEGLPDEWHHEPKGSYTTKGVIPEVPENVQLHVGWFDKTLPEFLAKHAEPVRIVNVDCDIYTSTKTVLDLLAPRMQIGTVIIFDEYIGNAHWREDEFKAFQESVTAYGWKYEYLCFSFFTKQVAVKLTSI
jgi:tetratricopeptide (TPR) repeat protein